MKALVFALLALGSSSLASAQVFRHISTYTCQVPAFLTFSIEKKYPGIPEVTITQKAYGLARGPATALARTLEILPANLNVESLHVAQQPWAAQATAEFTFTDGSKKNVYLESYDMFTKKDVYPGVNGSGPYPTVTLIMQNEGKEILSVTAQEHLCGEN